MKVKHNHSKKCHIKDTKQMYWVFNRVFWANKFGNEHTEIGRCHRFLEFICNDPGCKGKVFIDEIEINDKLVPQQEEDKETK